MQRVYCHACGSQSTVPSDWGGNCPVCQEGFCEVVGQDAPPAVNLGSRGPQPPQEYPGYHSSSFSLPGGRGTVQVIYGGGPGLVGGFGPAPFPGGAMMGPAVDPFELIRALMSGGAPFGGQDLRFGGFGADYDQQQMDRIVTQIMEQYQPQSRETARRVRDQLPRLKVRPGPAGSAGATAAGAAEDDSEMGMAAVHAGEPCSVCHEEFEAGRDVVELPCTHCFHEDCLMPWLETHNTCPVCRLELPTEADRQQSRRGQQQGAQGQPASRAGSRRQQQQGEGAEGAGGGGGFMGSLNQLLHNIADRWEQTHVAAADGGQPGSGGAQPTPPTSRQPSARGGAPASAPPPPAAAPSMPSHPSVPDSPRTAAGRAAAARFAGTAGPASGPSFSSGSASSNAAPGGRRNAPPQQQEQQEQPHSHQQRQQEPPREREEEEEGQSEDGGLLGMAVGGMLGALLGGAVTAFMGRNRQPRPRD